MTEQPRSFFYIPDVLADYPWKRQFNPHYEEVKEESDQWMYSFKAFSAKSQYAFDKGEFAHCTALIFPNTTKERLRVAMDLIHLFFIVDEYTDVESHEEARNMMKIASDALRHPEKARPKDEIVIGEMTRQLSQAVAKVATPIAAKRFVETLIEWFDSCVQQAGERDADFYHSISSYFSHRRANIGTEPSFVIYEFGLTLPDEVWQHPVLVEVRRLVAEMTIYINDMHSYNKEQAVGDDRCNLVTLIMREEQCPLQEAINSMSEQFATANNQFLKLIKEVPSFGPALDAQVREYLDGIGNWTRGVDTWEYECGRYFGDKGREVQRTRKVKLLPKAKAAYIEDKHAKKQNVVIPLVGAFEAAV